MRTLTVLAAAAALALAGCGGDDDESSGSATTSAETTTAARGYAAADPVAAVQAYVDAFGSGDYAAACALVDAEAMEKITQSGRFECEDVYAKGGTDVETTQKEFDGATASDPQIAGDRGSVGVKTKSGKEIRLPVVLENDAWKVAS